MVHWKSLRGMDDRFVGRRIAQQPSADDFAVMFQFFFRWETFPTATTCIVYRQCFDVVGIEHRVDKHEESGDDTGIGGELVQFASRNLLHDLLHLDNVVLNTSIVPSTWNKTMFIMLAHVRSAKLPSLF